VTRDTHYDLEILAELAEGLLDDATARQVREHLAICDPCGESLADLAAVREVLAAVPVAAMPLGVAMRIDRALEAEASTLDWDRIMRDAPWESTPEPEPAAAPLSLVSAEVPVDLVSAEVSLGVVSADGTIVPARRGKPVRRRRWAAPVAAVAAAAAVVAGGVSLAGNLLTSAAGPTPTSIAIGPGDAPASPSKNLTKATAGYTVYASGHNYTNRELNGPLLGYFGVAPGSGVDKANYNGNEATIMAFWEDQSINAVRVVVVDDDCKRLRPESLATWN
jgi:hypothetical protein